MKRFLAILTMLLLSFLVAAPQGLAHEPRVHQYIVKQAYCFLHNEKGPIPELEELIGLDFYGYGSDDDPWYIGRIGVGAWREDLEDPVWDIGGPFNGWTPSSTHFWDPDAGDDATTPIPASPDAPNAYQKARIYLFGGHNIFIYLPVLWPQVDPNYPIRGVYYRYDSLVEFYRTGRCYIVGYMDYWGFSHYWTPAEVHEEINTARRYAVLILGRVAHLLGDMSTPAHTHGDIHPDGDVYEGLMNDYYVYWNCLNARQQGPLLDAYRAAPGGDPLRVIRYLFYTTAQVANRFPSNDAQGDTRYATSYLGDDYSVLNLIQEITHPLSCWWPYSCLDVVQISNYAFRYGIRSTADLLYWFATETGMLKKLTVRNDFNAGQIKVNGQTYPSGYILGLNDQVKDGTTVTLDAGSPQTLGDRVYDFDRWEKRDSAGNVVETNPSPSWTISVDGDYTYVAVSKFDFYISGPEELYFKQIGTFTAMVSGGIGPITYQWRWRRGNPYPPGPWSEVVSASPTYKATMVATDFELQLKVTGNGREIYRTKYVKCEGAPCTYSISPSSNYLSASGGTGSFRVTAGSRCFWEAFSKVDWITITSEGDGSGNGTVQYSVASNTSSTSRTSTLKVAGRSHTVTQGGAPCAYSLSPGSQSLSASGGTGIISVTAGGGCSWTAVSNVDWITITSGSNGTGNGTVQYFVVLNTRPGSRTGTLTIAGNTFTLTQAGAGKLVRPELVLE